MTLKFKGARKHRLYIEDKYNLRIDYQLQLFEENVRDSKSVSVVDSIRGINLSNNNLDSLENELFPNNMRHLFLHNNKLKKLPQRFLADFSGFRKVSLSGNPWICDCDTVDFRRCILSNEEIILDGNQTLCGKSDENGLESKAIWKLDDRDLCPVLIGLYFSVLFGIIAFSLVITVLKIVHTRYEKNIKVWLYAHGVTWVKERDIDRDKIFDAFLSYSHEDENLVITQIISEIRAKQPATRLCIHYMHFEAGVYIGTNILNAIQNSKRTVLILSKNFLESEWCIFEFRAAHLQALKDRINRVIVIKLGDLPDNLDKDIKMYLDSTNYLTWGEKYFWERLFYVLPTGSKLETKTAIESNCDFKDSTTNLI